MIRKNILSICVALIIVFLSLANARDFNSFSFVYFRGIDKVVHFGMYFGFMSVILFEHRKNILESSQLYLIGIIPFTFGALMELFQYLFTSTRSASFLDMMFNLGGILFSIFIFTLLKRYVRL